MPQRRPIYSYIFLKTTDWSLFFPLTVIIVLLSTGLPIQSVSAQSNRIIPLEDWSYEYIKRLQRRGYLLDLHPTALPYKRGEVTDALGRINIEELSPLERSWVSLLKKDFLPDTNNGDGLHVGGSFEVGAFTTNNDRLDPLRYTDRGDPTLAGEQIRLYPYVQLFLYSEINRLVAHAGMRHDVFYRDDPDGIVSVLRIWTRNEKSYFGYNGRLLNLYLGRYSNHWGLHGGSAALISNNPRSYDHLNLRLGNKYLFFQSILGELDSITADGRFTGAAGADSVRSNDRRFLSAHRLDWRPSRRLSLTLMEATIYSGPGTSFSLKYMNPFTLHVFAVDNKPKNEENNGLLAVMVWTQLGKLSLHGQLMVDDFDFRRESGEPATVALTSSMYYSAILPAVDIGFQFDLVSARAYNTHQPEGRYVYMLRGIATQFNDYVQSTVTADIYCDTFVPGLTVSPYVAFLRQGDQDMRSHFPDHETGFMLDGTVERTTRLATTLFFQNNTYYWIRLDLGINRVENRNFVVDASENRFVGYLQIGGRVSLSKLLKDGI